MHMLNHASGNSLLNKHREGPFTVLVNIYANVLLISMYQEISYISISIRINRETEKKNPEWFSRSDTLYLGKLYIENDTDDQENTMWTENVWKKT